jgi:hypothetical protein
VRREAALCVAVCLVVDLEGYWPERRNQSGGEIPSTTISTAKLQIRDPRACKVLFYTVNYTVYIIKFEIQSKIELESMFGVR